ncbi:hypothetical protein GR268_47045, partial [Rhizobium leguminosarum]|nr:hypothetical protein [Rhizobium leguminosarum]
MQCPSLAYHLVGAKKIQQVLSKDGVLERFFPDDAEVCMAQQAMLDSFCFLLAHCVHTSRHAESGAVAQVLCWTIQPR